MEYYSIIKRNEKPIHATTWMKLGNNMPSARSQITKDHILYYFKYVALWKRQNCSDRSGIKGGGRESMQRA